MSELDGKPQPDLFRSALASYEASAKEMTVLDTKFDELIAIDKSGQKVKVYEDALAKILREIGSFERISARGARYSNVGGVRPPRLAPIRTSTDILLAQQQDLQILRKGFDEAIVALRDAIPIAEKGEFVRVMLSGRNAFGDKMPKFTDMISAYERFNIRSCMATIDATMQVYPRGFEWLLKQ